MNAPRATARHPAFAATLMVLMSCDTGAETADSATRRDSAGIEIIDLRRSGWGDEPTIQLEPVLSVGEAGRDNYEFGRVADAALDTRRRLLVLDPQAQQLKVYDSTGTFAMTVGGPGEGPGELSRWITDVMAGPGDTIFIPDYAQARINVYAPEGSYTRTISVPARPSGQSWTLITGGGLYRVITISRDDMGRFQTRDAHGSYLGPVTVPARFRITRITENVVVGVARDDLDVERVVILRMS